MYYAKNARQFPNWRVGDVHTHAHLWKKEMPTHVAKIKFPLLKATRDILPHTFFQNAKDLT